MFLIITVLYCTVYIPSYNRVWTNYILIHCVILILQSVQSTKLRTFISGYKKAQHTTYELKGTVPRFQVFKICFLRATACILMGSYSLCRQQPSSKNPKGGLILRCTHVLYRSFEYRPREYKWTSREAQLRFVTVYSVFMVQEQRTH
jgi:hypothetical protein